ncbi:uncharacterized protein susd5, partial [Chanos chanos]|uniref:Uncharacterized protein susd5 n=1 Tax=Chanos chanos TaxID=29144 RepID=A0A6J2WJ58_CHACN
VGRVFLLELQSGSETGSEEEFEEAKELCAAHGSRVASGVELRHAAVECSFSVCARGWLDGHRIGTTVCRDVAGSLRAVDVQVQNVTEDAGRLGVFCVKDRGAPCGAPPSFPHTRLQGQTGLELGDELLYTCNPGYTLPNGETAFSLLCDSCGEWYGMVQLCVKADAEAHVDYEDKFADEHHVYDDLGEESHAGVLPAGGDVEGHEEEEEEDSAAGQVVGGQEEEDNEEGDSTVSVTEAPVSQLSQKHLFWFPSEAFQEEEHPHVTVTPIKDPTQDQNYITAKTSDSQSEPKGTTEDYGDVKVDDSQTEDHVKHSVSSTEESWLDGYPVSPEEDKAGGGSTVEAGPEQEVEFENVTQDHKEEEFGEVTGSPDEEEPDAVTDSPVGEGLDAVMHRPVGEESDTVTDSPVGEELDGATDSPVGEGLEEVTDSPVTDRSKEMDFEIVRHRPEDEVEEEDFEGVTGSPESVTDSPAGVKIGGVIERANGLEASPSPDFGFTQITAGPDEHALKERPAEHTPGSAPENVSTSHEGVGPDLFTTPSGMEPSEATPTSTLEVISNVATPTTTVSWGTKDQGHFFDHTPYPELDDAEVTVSSHEEKSPTGGSPDDSLTEHRGAGSDACEDDECPSSHNGPVIAMVIVGIVAALVAVALGVWCYRRRQQKSSHYQLNGTNRQTQCIEMQQTV